MNKTCKKCLRTKPIEDFQTKLSNRWCKGVRKAYVLGSCKKCNYIAQKLATEKRVSGIYLN